MRAVVETFTSKQISEALGISAKDVQNWTTRGLIVGQRDAGRGHTREYTWSNVMEIAIADSLMKIGLTSPKIAFEAAQKFAHAGHGAAGWVGDPSENKGERLPGLPYHHNLGDTYLYVCGQKKVVAVHRIGEDIDDHVRGYLGAPLLGYIAVNVSEVFARTLVGLGYRDPEAFLDNLYPADAW